MTLKKRAKNNNLPKQPLDKLLIQTGFVPPLSDDDIKLTEEKFGTTDIILPPEVDSPDFIFERLNKSEKRKKVEITDSSFDEIKKKQNDYFKKLVLAAEIVYQLHNEPTFGHIKFVKVYFICEEICKMQLSTNYGQYAAGPLDPKHLHTIDAEFRKRKWFTVTKRKGGYGFTYAPDNNVNDYRVYYLRYFKTQTDTINRIIELFKKQSSDFCEIVATLFAVWKKELEEGPDFTDTILINKFYGWSDKKKRFSNDKLINALSWMRENDIVPIVF